MSPRRNRPPLPAFLAAVALLLILSALLMVEFMEHYFCRNRTSHGGTYETILLA